MVKNGCARGESDESVDSGLPHTDHISLTGDIPEEQEQNAAGMFRFSATHEGCRERSRPTFPY